MKHILLLSVLLLCIQVPLGAKPAALLNRYVNENLCGSSQQVTYFTDKILKGQPIHVVVEVPHHPEQQKQYEAYVQQLYNMWFGSTAQIIRASGRTEFDDLLPLLSRQVNLRFVTKEDRPEVRFLFTTPQEVVDSCGGDEGVKGCVKSSKSPLQVYVSDKIRAKPNEVNSTHLHEVGHTLGLADQYYDGRNTNANLNYASPVRKKSVMNNNGPTYVKGITADDADGLVLAADLALKNYNRGGEAGWKSLDPKSKQYYVHGKVANSPHAFYLESYDGFARINFLQYDKNNRPSKQEYMSFSSSGLDVFSEPQGMGVLLRDAQGRPVVEKGPTGQTIYTSYLYETTFKLVVDKQRKVLRYEKVTYDDVKRKDVAFKDVYGGTPQALIVLRGKVGYFLAKKEVMYDAFGWEGKHILLTSITCTKKKCETQPPSRPVVNQVDASRNTRLGGNLEQNVLFEKLKAWLKGKGTLKTQ